MSTCGPKYGSVSLLAMTMTLDALDISDLFIANSKGCIIVRVLRN